MRELTALAADVFAGGFALGVGRHFNVLAHFEENNYGVRTARHNFPGRPIIVGKDNWPIDEYRDKVDFVFANPPCAAWSVAGYTKTRGPDKWRTDPRVECSRCCAQLRRKLRPAVYATESVTQLWSKGREFAEELARDAAEDGYSTTVLLHDAQHLGLPQVRRRVFLVQHRVEFRPIMPNWAPPPSPLDVLPDKPIGEPMWEKPKYFTAKRLAQVKPGERLVHFWERKHPEEKRERNAQGNVKGRPSYGHYRLPVEGPGGAVVGYNIVHPTEHRFISTEEMQLLSGFPLDFHFTPKGPNARAAEIARGVCPTVGEWLARGVKASIETGKEITSPTLREWNLLRPPVGSDDPVRDVEYGERPTTTSSVAVSRPKEAKAKPAKPTQMVMADVLRMPKPKEGVGSGAFIKLLLDMEKWTTDEIVQAVRTHYKASKATGADVAYHRGEMRAAGRMVGVVKQTAAGRKLVPYVKKEMANV